MGLRRTLLWLHRWAGILAGLVILVVAVTGGALVFERQLDRWMNPHLYPHGGSGGARVPVAQALAMLRESRPGAPVAGIILPKGGNDALKVFTGNHAVHLDPETGRVLGSRIRNAGFFRTMTRLHVSLLAGKTGGTIVAVATLITIGLALSGLWLWWPLKIFGFRKGAGFRRFNLDLHSAAGLYSSAFLLVIAATGATIHYLDHDHPKGRFSKPQPGRNRISVDEAVAKAEAALPGAKVVSLEMPPPNPRAPYHLQLAFPEDASPAGRSVVFLDQFSGETLDVHSSREGTLLERYQELQLSMHTGGIFGLPTMLAALLACGALILQIASGYVLWWKRA